ncbi:MAG: glycosyltransferase family 39 protein [Haliscomenobacter sp.]|nr:glycosyltransferase family 39 protein [Haliscomenobacter sp.]
MGNLRYFRRNIEETNGTANQRMEMVQGSGMAIFGWDAAIFGESALVPGGTPPGAGSHTGNYWASTLFGEWYYNKPPLFNWVLLLFAWLGGGFREWALRLPTVLSVAGLAVLLFLFGKKYVSARFGMVSALLLVSFSAVLFYFSALAEIDLFYALLVFGGWLAMYHFGERKQYGLMFFLVYLSCALGVMAKGLPSLAFTALSLLAYFVDTRRFRVLFSLPHIAGILFLAALLGGYAWKYAQYNKPLVPAGDPGRGIGRQDGSLQFSAGFLPAVGHFSAGCVQRPASGRAVGGIPFPAGCTGFTVSAASVHPVLRADAAGQYRAVLAIAGHAHPVCVPIISFRSLYPGLGIRAAGRSGGLGWPFFPYIGWRLNRPVCAGRPGPAFYT